MPYDECPGNSCTSFRWAPDAPRQRYASACAGAHPLTQHAGDAIERPKRVPRVCRRPNVCGKTRSSWPSHGVQASAASRSAACAARWRFNVSATGEGIGTNLRERSVFGSSNTNALSTRESVHLTRTCPPAESTSLQCNANASPRRRPVPSMRIMRGSSRSPLANPFVVGAPGDPDADTAVRLHKAWMLDPNPLAMRINARLVSTPPLPGKTLGCNCPLEQPVPRRHSAKAGQPMTTTWMRAAQANEALTRTLTQAPSVPQCGVLAAGCGSDQGASTTGLVRRLKLRQPQSAPG